MEKMIIVNFKNYVFGEKAVKLARICKKVDKKIILGVNAADLYRIVKESKMKCYVQHVDGYLEKGRNTGYILPESVKFNNGKGVFLNHSEHRIKFNEIKKSVERCKKLKLKSLVFVKNVKEGIKISKLKPSYIVIEPSELIGGKISVSKARPSLIKDSVEKINAKVLVGAGIHCREDVLAARKLGAKGIVVSSAVATAKNPEKVLKELLMHKKSF